ncbi:unnamed protein product [Mytilus edulis]|uniref:Uncharacterized protein n=1 Tax=Mytilus edulis TaxID=6550 RepID=A0A8S3TWV5_MYTED|nr:unnamed protein product [Mytilus edulis]
MRNTNILSVDATVIVTKEPYQITVNSSSPAVLDSVIRFSANISSLEEVLSNKTLFVYRWVNTANKNTLTSEANYTSSIDINTFLSYAVSPGEYHMKVTVYKKEKIWPFSVKIGHASTKFVLTEFLNGKLTIKQQLNDKMHVNNHTFATKKPLNLSSVLTDEFEIEYSYAYIWFVNGTFQEWNESYSYITYNGITPGKLNITVKVKASFDFLSNKEGIFTKFITLKDAINIGNITGENEVCEGQHMYVNVSYNGSNPTEICWHVMHINESLNCTWLNGNENRYTIDLHTDHKEGTYKLNITMKNDVSKAYALISFKVIDGYKDHKISSVMVVTITFCLVGLIVTVAALAYSLKVRKKYHITEVADFNFHPHIKKGPKISTVMKNLLYEFLEKDRLNRRQNNLNKHQSTIKTYGTIESSNDDDMLLYNL